MVKIGDRVLVKGMGKGTVFNVSDYREPSLKYAIDVDCYKEDLVFVGDNDIVKCEDSTDERAD